MNSSFYFIIILFSVTINKLIKRKSFDVFNKKYNNITYIESHRGFNKIFPQNTIPAFEKAIDNSIDGIELDIWLTKDKIPIVIHGGHIFGFLYGFIKNIGLFKRPKDFTLEEIKKLELKETNQKIPTLSEVLDLCKIKFL